MSDDDFLSRWARRKRAVAEEAAEPQEAVEGAKVDNEPDTDEDEDQILARLKLPVPESLQPGDDFSAFMAKGVPAFLRKRALRVLWRSNPVLANLDGLNDYDDDFTSPELTQKVLATAYQVGRGFVTQTPETEEAETASDPVEVDAAMEPLETESAISSENQDSVQVVVPDDEPEPVIRPRRMRFES